MIMDDVKSLAKMTHVEIIDFVIAHFKEQKAIAKTYSGSGVFGGCFYRLNKDEKTIACAVGCLMPDSIYSASFENKSVHDLVDSLKDFLEHERKNCLDTHNFLRFVEKKEDFLSSLQELHDESDSLEEFIENLYVLREQYV